MKTILASAFALALGAFVAPAASQAAPPPPTGFTLTWADDFDRPAGTIADPAIGPIPRAAASAFTRWRT